MNGSFQGLLMPQSHWISLRSPFGRNTHSNHMIGAAMCFAHKLVQTHIQDQHLLLLSCVLMREVKTQRTGHGIMGYLPIGKLLSPVKDSMPFACWMLYSAVPISQYWTNPYVFPSFPGMCSTPSCHSHWTYGLEYYTHFGQYIHPMGSWRVDYSNFSSIP